MDSICLINYKMEIEKIFSLISKPVEKFAKQHNLLIDKYHQDSPSWFMYFKRKTGGIGYIYINYLSQNTHSRSIPTHHYFEIVDTWILDDYNTETRHLAEKKIGILKSNNNDNEIENLLNQALNNFKDFHNEDLIYKTKNLGWKKYWKTKEEFEQSIKFPELDV